MGRNQLVLILLFSLACFPFSASGQDLSQSPEEDPASSGEAPQSIDNNNDDAENEESQFILGAWMDSTFNWMESQRDYLADKVTDTAVVMDEYIARDTFDDSIVNESYLRVRFTQPISTGADNDFQARVRASIDVPNAEEKVKLFLDTNPEDFNSIQDRERDNTGGDIGSGDALLGVSFWEFADENWNPSLSLGVSTSPLEFYGKIKFQNYTDLGKLWQAKTDQSFTYFDSQGWISNTRLNLYRPMSNRGFLRTTTEAQYIQRDEPREIKPGELLPLDNYWEFFHGWSYYRTLDNDTSIEYSINATALSKPNPSLSNFWLRAEWRKLIHDDWLFLKISPEISFPRYRDFKDTYAIFFELEIYIGRNFDPKEHLNF